MLCFWEVGNVRSPDKQAVTCEERRELREKLILNTLKVGEELSREGGG